MTEELLLQSGALTSFGIMTHDQLTGVPFAEDTGEGYSSIAVDPLLAVTTPSTTEETMATDAMPGIAQELWFRLVDKQDIAHIKHLLSADDLHLVLHASVALGRLVRASQNNRFLISLRVACRHWILRWWRKS